MTHHIRVSELAYGSEKAKELFREMMKRAQTEVGFQLEEHMPIMVEAIPEKSNSLVLIITKVENPDEIDTRFTKLSPSPLAAKIDGGLSVDGADDIIDLFKKLHDSKPAKSTKEKPGTAGQNSVQEKKPLNLLRLYRFDELDEVIAAAHALGGYYTGSNTLYKNRKTGEYQLVIHQSSHTPEEFNKICNILSEYAVGAPFNRAFEAHLEEHETIVFKGNAIQQLSSF